MQAPSVGPWKSTSWAPRSSASGSVPSWPLSPTKPQPFRATPHVGLYPAGANAIDPNGAPGHDECLPRTSVAPSVRGLFAFEYFNKMQSKCFGALYKSDENCVIGAPTAAGKTVCFELALARHLEARLGRPKVLYLAPLKSLVQERLKDWKGKLVPLKVTCQELSGDAQEPLLANADLLLTTPEKWDAITRHWKEHIDIVSKIGLILVDEVHLLGDERGAVLEAVLTRMRLPSLIGTPPRIIALSASSPNVTDIGEWLNSPPHCVFFFGEDHRPITPSLHVIGYPSSKNNYFFDMSLDNKLWGVVQTYSDNKPTLVFCQSRNATVVAANKLVSECARNSSSYVKSEAQKERLFEAARKIENDQQLAACILNGIAYHHAGMTQGNRALVEQLFGTGKDVMVVVATSTLAVGVNMPAYLVVIKGTSHWNATSSTVEECTPLNMKQMIGRAGRPQYGDKSACAVIMTQQTKVATYEQLFSTETALTESTLHRHLPEALLSEIIIGSIQSIKDVITYLQQTFFAIRLRKNPSHYAHTPSVAASSGAASDHTLPSTNSTTFGAPTTPLPATGGSSAALASSSQSNSALSNVQWVAQLRAFSMNTLGMLTKFNCIAVEQQRLVPSELARAISRCFLSFASVQAIFDAFPADTPLSPHATTGLLDTDITTPKMLECIAASPEFSDVIVRRAEKKELKDISAASRYPIKRGINREEKVLILILSQFTSTRIADPSLKQDAFACFLKATSLCTCLVQYFIIRGWLHTAHRSILLLKCLRKACWAAPSFPQTSQVPIITKAMAKVLSQAGINTLAQLQRRNPQEIERMLSQNHLFVQNVFSHLHQMPIFSLTVSLVRRNNMNVLAFEAMPVQASGNPAEMIDFRWLLLGQRGQLLHCRSVPVCYSLGAPPTEFSVDLPLEVSGAVDVLLVSAEWIGYDIVSRISLDPHFTEAQLIAEEDSQDPYADEHANAKKRKRQGTTSEPAEKKPKKSNANNPQNGPPSLPSTPPATEPCTHKCKNKFTCKHDCCKLHPTVRASGNTRIELIDDALAHSISVAAVQPPVPSVPSISSGVSISDRPGPAEIPSRPLNTRLEERQEDLEPLPSSVRTKPSDTGSFLSPTLNAPRLTSANMHLSSKAAGIVANTLPNVPALAISNPRLLSHAPTKLTSDPISTPSFKTTAYRGMRPQLKLGAKEASQVSMQSRPQARIVQQSLPPAPTILPENVRPSQLSVPLAQPVPTRPGMINSAVASRNAPPPLATHTPSKVWPPNSTATWSALLNWELDPYGPEP